MLAVDRLVQISWKEPPQTFFRTEHFKILFTTNDWKTTEEVLVPKDQYFYNVKEPFPCARYKCKVVTCVQNSVESLSSEEAMLVPEGIIISL